MKHLLSFCHNSEAKKSSKNMYWSMLLINTICRIKAHRKNLFKRITRCVIWRKREKEKSISCLLVTSMCNLYMITRRALDGVTWFMIEISLLSHSCIPFNIENTIYLKILSNRFQKCSFLAPRPNDITISTHTSTHDM